MFKNLICSIGLINSYNLLIFIFRNFKFDLKDNLVNNLKKIECSQISKFLRLYTRRLKNHLGVKFCTEVLTLLKKRRL